MWKATVDLANIPALKLVETFSFAKGLSMEVLPIHENQRGQFHGLNMSTCKTEMADREALATATCHQTQKARTTSATSRTAIKLFLSATTIQLGTLYKDLSTREATCS